MGNKKRTNWEIYKSKVVKYLKNAEKKNQKTDRQKFEDVLKFFLHMDEEACAGNWKDIFKHCTDDQRQFILGRLDQLFDYVRCDVCVLED